jgi:CubicO group peptidase (beta-lactamase class C family)
MSDKTLAQGFCDDRFSAVKKAFTTNFESGSETGASCAVAVDGKLVVDLWGGYADKSCTRPWERDTIVNVFSMTKVMTAVSAMMLVDRGQLDLDAPVARYWPEFAANGKADIPVRYLFSHASGLAGWQEPVNHDTIYDWDKATSMLAAEKPFWEPGKGSGYHGLTMGYLLGELVRRITGKSVGTFFRDEIARPLDVDFHIGTPAECDSRIAEVITAAPLKPSEPGYVQVNKNSLRARVMANEQIDIARANETAWRRAEIPAANGHGNARAAVKVASVLACGGSLDGVKLMTRNTIRKMLEEQTNGKDWMLGDHIRWGLGVELDIPERTIGKNSFSWGGAGGSIVVVDLDRKLAWAYVMNRGSHGAHFKDPRNRAIAAAIDTCLPAKTAKRSASPIIAPVDSGKTVKAAKPRKVKAG